MQNFRPRPVSNCFLGFLYQLWHAKKFWQSLFFLIPVTSIFIYVDVLGL